MDEYQDTNASQYMLLRLLSGKKNICCVGDEDQSIYGWRGAQLKNILNFENDFDGAKIIRLEQNYRSSGNILNAASSLISENKERELERNSGPLTPLVSLLILLIWKMMRWRQFL